jgi:very-short-patch-repair endonuclease
MTEIFNKYKEKEKRRLLRHNQTRAEAMVWEEIRKRKILGQRFLRQFSVNAFVVDFYCPKLKLVIEIDGVTHQTEEEKEYDKQRQSEIELLGIIFLRFKNEEVFEDLESVVQVIKNKVEELINPPQSPFS